MCRPPRGTTVGIELAEIVRSIGPAYRAAHRLCAEQEKALRAIGACRTSELGGQVVRCEHCGSEVRHYHSCRNRHCPKCQSRAKEQWVRQRQAELLPVEYFHVVFTLPHGLNLLAQWQPRLVYGLLFQCAAQTLLEVGRNPRWLGAEVGVTAVLHTWGQRLDQHIHLHCIVSGGGLAQGQWRSAKPHFLFPVRVLSRVFRGKYLEALEAAWQGGEFAPDRPPSRGMAPEDFQRLGINGVVVTFLALVAVGWSITVPRSPLWKPQSCLPPAAVRRFDCPRNTGCRARRFLSSISEKGSCCFRKRMRGS